MTRRARQVWLAVTSLALLSTGVLVSPAVVRAYWRWHASNPVRRGVARAAELGCFSCHGPLGSQGVPEPAGGDVPAWSGGVWMMYVEDAAEVRQFILDGVSAKRADSASATAQRRRASIHMPAYRSVLRRDDLEDLTAAFLVLSGMRLPPEGTPQRRGHERARRWSCFSCHGPAGSGGLPNPGSYTGFIPGWYGPDFAEMVHGREEFTRWVREGEIARLREHPAASFFIRRQRLRMPAYPHLSEADLDDLWAYVQWLNATGGGVRAQD